eukprot:XP_001709531.1 Hypothetical protein GL50803_32109 [Giardia lamblia ATCC 50803]
MGKIHPGLIAVHVVMIQSELLAFLELYTVVWVREAGNPELRSLDIPHYCDSLAGQLHCLLDFVENLSMIVCVAMREVDANNIGTCPDHSCYDLNVERRRAQRAANLHAIEVRVILIHTFEALLDELLEVCEVVLGDLICCKLIVKHGRSPTFG